MEKKAFDTLGGLIEALIAKDGFKKKVLLIRHGESEGNVKDILGCTTDWELTQAGIEQAKGRYPMLKPYFDKIDYIKCSTQIRSIQTCHNALNIENHKEIKDLIEYDHKIKEYQSGTFENAYRKHGEVPRKEFLGFMHILFMGYLIPQGAEGREFGKRIRKSLNEAQEGLGLYFTHSGCIYNLTNPYIGKRYMKNCGVSAFAYNDDFDSTSEFVGYFDAGAPEPKD